MSDSEDEFSIFNQLPSPEPPVNDSSHLPLVQVSSTQEDTIVPEVMGIQRKPRTNLLDVMESQAWGKAQKKTSQAKLPPLLPLNPFDLTLPITKGKGIRQARKWWKEGRVAALRRTSSKKGLSRSG